MTGGTEHGVQTEIDMGQDIAVEDDLHIIVRVAERVLTRAECQENRIQPNKPHHHHHRREDDIHHDHIAQYAVRPLVVFLTQVDSQQRRSPDAHQAAEGSADVHEGFGDRQRTQCQRTATVTDIDTVHDVVQRSSRHRNDGG